MGTRAQIVGAAIAAAHELGVEFTLDGVVARLPFSKGAVLHHFPSKQALLEAVVDEIGGKFVAAVRATAARDPDPRLAISRAYLAVTADGMGSEDELRLTKVALIACLISPTLAQRWMALLGVLTEDDPDEPSVGQDALAIRLVADGLWLTELMGEPAPASQRAHLLDRILKSKDFP